MIDFHMCIWCHSGQSAEKGCKEEIICSDVSIEAMDMAADSNEAEQLGTIDNMLSCIYPIVSDLCPYPFAPLICKSPTLIFFFH